MTEQSPENAEFHFARANSLDAQKQQEAAAQAFQQAIRIKPDYVEALVAIGNLYCRMRQFDRAIEPYQRALELNETLPGIHNNLAIAFQRTGQLPHAIHNFEKACALHPHNPEIRWSLARALLLNGDFRRGWTEYECRFLVTRMKLLREFPQPRWMGQNPRGKTILLYTEGGFGDALHFVRYAPMLAAEGANVILQCQPQLLTLFKSVKGVSQVIARSEPLPAFHYQSPLQSLPLMFETTLETIPLAIPYFSPPAELVQHWKQRLAGDKSFKIGLAWAGSPLPNDLRTRSLASFEPLARIPGVSFYSLQKGEEANQPAPPKMNLQTPADPAADFADTAALAMNLDLIISVDTSIAHLAGGLGLATWVLLPDHSDFRWLVNRSDSPWYPTMRLFRKKPNGDWAEPIEQMAGELQKRVADKSS